MSTLGERIKYAREQKKLLQSDLAKLIGVKSAGVISNWEKDLNKPDAEKIVKLCEVLNVSVSYLLDYYGKSEFEINLLEQDHIKKYRFISLHSPEGVKTVDYILDREYGVAEQIQKHNETLSDLQKQYFTHPTQLIELEQTAHTRYAIPYYQRLASAGSGEYLFDNIPTETIEIPANSLLEKADFAIGVNGNSMEPTYCDGDKVYVRLADKIPMGRIGIFVRGNECFIKELGMDRLISHNKEHSDIPATEDIRLVGEVLGKVEED